MFVRFVPFGRALTPRAEHHGFTRGALGQFRRRRRFERRVWRRSPEEGGGDARQTHRVRVRHRHPVPRGRVRAARDSIEDASREDDGDGVSVVGHLGPLSGAAAREVLESASAGGDARGVVEDDADEARVGVDREEDAGVDAVGGGGGGGGARDGDGVFGARLGAVALDVPLGVVGDGAQLGLEPAGGQLEAALEGGEGGARDAEGRGEHGAHGAFEFGGGGGVVGGDAEARAVGEDETFAGGVVGGTPSRGVHAGGVRGVRLGADGERVGGVRGGAVRHPNLGGVEASRVERLGLGVHADARHPASLQALRRVVHPHADVAKGRKGRRRRARRRSLRRRFRPAVTHGDECEASDASSGDRRSASPPPPTTNQGHRRSRRR